MQFPEFDEFVSHVQNVQYRIAKDFKKPDDDWTPTLLMVTQNADLIVSPVFFNKPDDKEAFVGAVIVLFRLATPEMAAFVSSCWYRSIKNDDPDYQSVLDAAGRQGLGQDPKREEIVFMLAATADGREKQYQAPIRRTADAPPTLGAWSEWEGMSEVSGRFGTLFKRAFEASSKARARKRRDK